MRYQREIMVKTKVKKEHIYNLRNQKQGCFRKTCQLQLLFRYSKPRNYYSSPTDCIFSVYIFNRKVESKSALLNLEGSVMFIEKYSQIFQYRTLSSRTFWPEPAGMCYPHCKCTYDRGYHLV